MRFSSFQFKNHDKLRSLGSKFLASHKSRQDSLIENLYLHVFLSKTLKKTFLLVENLSSTF
jgi:hypothetical protein